jgi:hypothetical protein
MTTNHEHFTRAMMPAPDMRETQECMRLILKLRWIGLSDEADRLERAVRGLAPDDRGTVLAGPASTD